MNRFKTFLTFIKNFMKMVCHFVGEALAATMEFLLTYVGVFLDWYRMVPRKKQMTKSGLLHDAAVVTVSAALAFAMLYVSCSVIQAGLA